MNVDSERDFGSAFATLIERGVGALVIAGSVFLDTYYGRLATLALQYSVPAMMRAIANDWHTILATTGTRAPALRRLYGAIDDYAR